MIKTARNKTLNESSGTLPNLRSVLNGYFQKMILIKSSNEIVNFRTVKSTKFITFMGVIQPFSDEQLKIEAEGQRDWKWYMLHVDPNEDIDLNDRIEYLSTTYKVMQRRAVNQYGYLEFKLIEEFQEDEAS